MIYNTCLWVCIRNTSIYLWLTNWSNKLDCFITLSWKDLLGTNILAYLGPFVSCKENYVLWMRLQNHIHSTCNLWLGPVSPFQYTRLESPARDKHPSLLGPFVSCKENDAATGVNLVKYFYRHNLHPYWHNLSQYVNSSDNYAQKSFMK